MAAQWMVVGLVMFVALLGSNAWAGRANDTPYRITQPDGNAFFARLQGDEWDHWVENEAGYAIAPDRDRTWFYLDTSVVNLRQSDAARFHGVLTSIPAHFPPPSGLQKYDPVKVPSAPQSEFKPVVVQTAAPYAGPVGQFDGKLLLILVQFDDVKGTYPPARWGPGSFSPNDSIEQIARYFNKASYGKVTLTPAEEKSRHPNDGVIGWLNVSRLLRRLEMDQNVVDQSGNHPDTGAIISGGEGHGYFLDGLVAKAAIRQASNHVNFAQYDINSDDQLTADELAIQIVVAGYEASDAIVPGKSVWRHFSNFERYSMGMPVVDGKRVTQYSMVGEIDGNGGDHQTPYGALVHEFGHQIFGWPDLYNTKTKGEGIGPWCVMGSGDWGKLKTQKFIGQNPVLPSAFVKWQSGWIVPQIPAGADVLMTLTAAGATSATSENTVVRGGWGNAPEQFFLIENRENIGYDKGLQGRLNNADWQGGLAIWHVDTSRATNRVDARRLVSLEGANGANGTTQTYYSADVLFHEGGNSDFTAGTQPGSKLYSGAPSFLIVEEISKPGSTMTARIEQAGKLLVMIEPQGARNAGAKWRACRNGPSLVVCRPWLDSHFWVEFWPGYQTTVEFAPIAGWSAPNPKNPNIEPLNTTQIVGTYINQAFPELIYGGEYVRDSPYRLNGQCDVKIEGKIDGPKAAKLKEGDLYGYGFWNVEWLLDLNPQADEGQGQVVQHHLELSDCLQVGDSFVENIAWSGEQLTRTIVSKNYKVKVRKYDFVGSVCQPVADDTFEWNPDGIFTINGTVLSKLDGFQYRYCVSDDIIQGRYEYGVHYKYEKGGDITREENHTEDSILVSFGNQTFHQ